MNKAQWNAFCTFRSNFKNQISIWNSQLKKQGFSKILSDKQKELAFADNVPDYQIETPLVYNTSLDEITQEDDIKLIVIGDNPGKDEQLIKNRRYLVGQSGKIAEGFFRRNPELGVDFRKNVIILNKTPIHTAKTKELKKLTTQSKQTANVFENSDLFKATEYFSQLLLESQIWMAQYTAQLHINLCKSATDKSNRQAPCQLWLVGYGELKNKGIFLPYAKKLKECYTSSAIADSVFVFQHFSMNRFLIDLRAHTDQNFSLTQNIENIGRIHRKEILFF
ncbi:MAG: hypothetical protein BKP49_10415 [Treponema sp. CETP13]|nr:MAG: hypothetical protein BKP49_10415 [Treponema sp. CETP13]